MNAHQRRTARRAAARNGLRETVSAAVTRRFAHLARVRGVARFYVNTRRVF